MRKSILFFVVGISIVVACTDDEEKPGGNNVSPDNDSGTVEPGEDGSTPSGGDTGTQPPPSKVNITSETIDVDGASRTYDLAVPKTYDPGKTYPLILVFHGDGGDGPGMRKFTHKMHEASGDEAIVGYPTGRNALWETYGPSASNPDHVFMQKLIAALKAKYSISKVFADGWSKGGFFITHNVCRQPDMFDGAVIHNGGVPYDESTLAGSWPGNDGYQKCDGQTSRTQASMPVLITHGTNDGSVPWAGGDWLRQWYAFLNQCDDSLTKTTPAPCESHDNCTTGKPVVWCSSEGAGHEIWNGGAGTNCWAFLKSLL